MLSRRRFLAAMLAISATGPSLIGARRQPALRLGLVADVQFADVEPGQTRFYRQSVAKLAEAVELFNGLDLRWCVSLGDVIDRGWDSFEQALKPLAGSRHKFRHLLGNHDFEVPDAFKTRVPNRLGLKHRYYSLPAGEFCLVMLDTTDVSPYAYAQNSPENAQATAQWQRLAAAGAINAQPWNGAVGERQLALQRQLKSFPLFELLQAGFTMRFVGLVVALLMIAHKFQNILRVPFRIRQAPFD